MTENEIKAIKWIKNVRDDAVITLDHIQKNEPNVSPMLYAGRKKKAETIIEMCEELEQYRAIGTVEELKSMKENGAFTGVELAQLAAMQMRLKEYSAIGTIDEFKALKEKNKLIKPRFVMNKRSDTVSIWECRCGNLFRTKNKEGVLDGIDVNYCSKCGVKLDWQ